MEKEHCYNCDICNKSINIGDTFVRFERVDYKIEENKKNKKLIYENINLKEIFREDALYLCEDCGNKMGVDEFQEKLNL